ncbi:MAG TPA: hypothetical protein VGR54_09335 [Nitrosopumilaceae archaeon]|nr:hypothetical protein [Nitrosopumilaceae archaeon]
MTSIFKKSILATIIAATIIAGTLLTPIGSTLAQVQNPTIDI